MSKLILLGFSFLACLIFIPMCIHFNKEFEKNFYEPIGMLILPSAYFSLVLAMLSVTGFIFSIVKYLGG